MICVVSAELRQNSLYGRAALQQLNFFSFSYCIILYVKSYQSEQSLHFYSFTPTSLSTCRICSCFILKFHIIGSSPLVFHFQLLGFRYLALTSYKIFTNHFYPVALFFLPLLQMPFMKLLHFLLSIVLK